MLDLYHDMKIEEEKLHSKFKLLRDELQLTGETDILNQWTEGFVDRDNKIVKEFQTTFHSAFWEFFLHKAFNGYEFNINYSHNHPDFVVESPFKMNIEAVVAEIKKDGDREDKRSLDDILSMITLPRNGDEFKSFTNEAITRYSNAIMSKVLKFKEKYSKKEHVKGLPFAIALASYDQINYGREFIYPILALLYGMYFDNSENNFSRVEAINKPGTDSPIPVGIFFNESMEDISAVIFSCTVTLGKLTALCLSKGNKHINSVLNIRHDQDEPHFKLQIVSDNQPEEIDEGLFIFHNPNANIKIPFDVFDNKNIVQVLYKEGQLAFSGDSLPIVSRFNVPNFMMKHIDLARIFQALNPNYIMSVFDVDEIDLDIDPKEIALIDTENGIQHIVDLTDENVQQINDFNIVAGDKVCAAIKRETNSYGLCVKIELLKIKKI